MPRLPFLFPALLLFCAVNFTSTPVIGNERTNRPMDPDLQEFMLDQQKELEDFDQEIDQEYQTFIDENDRDFAVFLKEAWEEFDSEEPVKVIKQPKPDIVPQLVTPPVGTDKQPTPEPIRIVVNTPPVETKPATIRPVSQEPAPPTPAPPKPVSIPQPEASVLTPSQVPIPAAPVIPAAPGPDPTASGSPLSFDYFGTEMHLRFDPRLSRGITPPINNDSISRYWEAIAGTAFKPYIEQTLRYRDTLRLNDWGYLLLLDKSAAEILDDPSPNNRALFTWFMMTKAGYDCKVGFRDDTITTLMPAQSQLYGLFYFTIKNKKYYSVNLGPQGDKIGKIYTYRASYPGAETNLDFALPSYPSLKNDPAIRKLSFDYQGKEYSIKANYNKNSIPYFQYYPQNEVGVYADAQVPDLVKGSLLAELKPLIQDRPEAEAVNLLLRFTQTAFNYQTDDDQFHREKFLFPEETLFYPYSDCEDRSILFSYLVRNLLGLDVVLLNYPNHIATAVRLKENHDGDQIIVNGKPYTICDPTYINAELGHAMPQFREVTPKVITL
ncbi:MAG: hypothetical protein KJ950_14350 [Proteobacteria bacterium]|nr:hypothetical protein [Pseudomonadota bacterium]MBU1687896.1 hypothetical protein [Pseudomonadota bacterium]